MRRGWLQKIFLLSQVLLIKGDDNNNFCYHSEESCSKTKRMKSIRHDSSNGTIELVSDTPIPELFDGQVLVKVYIH